MLLCVSANEVFCAELSFFDEAITLVKSHYFDPSYAEKALNKDALQNCKRAFFWSELRAIECSLRLLEDPHTRILPHSDTEHEQTSIKAGPALGYGIVLDPLTPSVISQVQNDSPASTANLKAGDRIMAVDNLPVDYISEDVLLSKIEQPNKSEVLELDIQRGEHLFFSVSLNAKESESNAYKTKALEHKIFYLKLTNMLRKNLPAELKNLFKQPAVQQSKALILDLRNNSGGLLNNGIEIADLFLGGSSTIVHISDRSQKQREIKANPEIAYQKPLVILIDHKTASAGELLAAALKENHRAYLIGERSYGKGSVQKIKFLSNKTSLHITISKFSTPDRHEIDGKGVEADLVERNREKQIKLAISYLQKAGNSTAKKQ